MSPISFLFSFALPHTLVYSPALNQKTGAENQIKPEIKERPTLSSYRDNSLGFLDLNVRSLEAVEKDKEQE
jgi:hypothetical protein